MVLVPSRALQVELEVAVAVAAAVCSTRALTNVKHRYMHHLRATATATLGKTAYTWRLLCNIQRVRAAALAAAGAAASMVAAGTTTTTAMHPPHHHT